MAIPHMEDRFDIDGEQVTVRSEGSGGPVVYLQVFEGDGEEVWRACRELGCPDFTLASIGNLAWDDDLSPWECPPLTRDDAPCGGKAPAQLERLTDKIMPAVEDLLQQPAAYSALAGYSLAGLFALWAAYRTNRFSRIASASGSLWFPGFLDFARKNRFACAPDCVYLSLGSKEHKTPNRMLRSVKQNTLAFADLLQERGIPHVFETNPGNHFVDTEIRMAKGISWMLSH